MNIYVLLSITSYGHALLFTFDTFRTSHKGYDVVHIPHLKPKPFKTGEKLRAIKELPDWVQPAFKVAEHSLSCTLVYIAIQISAK
jgi:hypothetical protein